LGHDDERGWKGPLDYTNYLVLSCGEVGSKIFMIFWNQTKNHISALSRPSRSNGKRRKNMSVYAQNLQNLGFTLPEPALPIANYVPSTRSGNIVYISGQVSVDAGGGIKGRVGKEVDLDQAIMAARLCGLNLLTQLNQACGSLDMVVRVLKLNVFVQCTDDFIEIPKVANGCSDLMVGVFGEIGKHARSAVGVYCLPLGFSVEIDGQFQVLDRR